MKTYLAGPMRSIAEWNFPAFIDTGKVLVDLGHEVFNPAQHDIDNGFPWEGMTGTEDISELGFSLRQMLAADLEWIANEAEAICVLPGWASSRGARAEVALAAALGLQVGYLEQFEDGRLQPATEFWDQFFTDAVLIDESEAL